MPDTDALFDIRTKVHSQEKENALVEASYDMVNRMVELLRDISFRDLFTQQWHDLIPRIRSNAERLAAREDGPHLLPSVAAVLSALATLEIYADGSFRTVRFEPEASSFVEIGSALHNLWRLGVYLPYTGGEARAEPVVEHLLAVAPDLTYRDLFDRPKREFPKEVGEAVRAALRAGVLYEPVMNYCCFEDRFGNESCIFRLDHVCCCSGSSSTGSCASGCALASDPCSSGGGADQERKAADPERDAEPAKP
jgi:hypothetical protein